MNEVDLGHVPGYPAEEGLDLDVGRGVHEPEEPGPLALQHHVLQLVNVPGSDPVPDRRVLVARHRGRGREQRWQKSPQPDVIPLHYATLDLGHWRFAFICDQQPSTWPVAGTITQ